MRILILHQFFNTPERGGSLRSYYLGRALLEAGHSVTVITTHNHGTETTEQDEGMAIHYLPVAYRNHFGFFKRILSFIQFVYRIVKKAGQFRQAECCYAISAPLTTGLAAIWIRWRYGIPYYFEVGDLWPEAPIQLGIIRNGLLKKILYRLEASIYERATAVVALSGAIRQNILQRFPSLTVHVVPNMADTDFFKPEPKNAALEKHFGTSGKFVVSYIGTMGLANGLEFVIACAAEAMREQLPVHFLLCGEGARLDTLKKQATDRQLKNIQFIPHQNRDGVRKVLSVTDAVMICYRPMPVLETGSPNKYFDGLAAGKLIVVNTGGWMKDEVEDAPCGIAADPAGPGDFIRKIKPFVGNRAMLADHQQKSRELAERKYARHILGAAFTRIVIKS